MILSSRLRLRKRHRRKRQNASNILLLFCLFLSIDRSSFSSILTLIFVNRERKRHRRTRQYLIYLQISVILSLFQSFCNFYFFPCLSLYLLYSGANDKIPCNLMFHVCSFLSVCIYSGLVCFV